MISTVLEGGAARSTRPGTISGTCYQVA